MADATPPVLLLAWRRPETTRAVMESLRNARPSSLFIAVDGPAEHLRAGEAKKVHSTIEVIERSIDWPCHVQRKYSKINLGCRVGVTSAIDWFFSSVSEGIILEDDCVPHIDFFGYCSELLDRFRNSNQVMCISGDNSAGVPVIGSASYSFIRFPQIWGWATWRRAWKLYDRDLSRYQEARRNGTWEKRVPDEFQRAAFTPILDQLAKRGEPDTWDYQWAATLLLEGGLSIHPRVNLVSNVGFGGDATHTTTSTHPRAQIPVHPILPLHHRAVLRLHRRTNRDVFLATQVPAKAAAAARRRSLYRRALNRARSGTAHVAQALGLTRFG